MNDGLTVADTAEDEVQLPIQLQCLFDVPGFTLLK